MTSPASPAIVVGAGWAGLACAVTLAQAGVSVTVLEAARLLGGRARRIRFDGHRVDNGQHVLFGAYRTVLDLMRVLGLAEHKLFRRVPLKLVSYEVDGAGLELNTGRMPAPLHAALGLLAARGLSWPEKRAILKFMRAVSESATIGADISVFDLLHRHKQSPRSVRLLWQPLCLAILNTPIEQASATLFTAVLRAAFFAQRRASDMLLPLGNVVSCLPEPAREFIERHGGGVRLGERVLAVQIQNSRVLGVQLERSSLLANHVVVATPPQAASHIIPDAANLKPALARANALGHMPICTVYLQYPQHIRLDHDFIALLAPQPYWLFDRGRLTGERGLLAAVINGPGAHVRAEADTVIAAVTAAIADRFPNWPAPRAARLVRERQATFTARVGCERLRPDHTTPVAGLWLAGDYTATGFPATLEGAARSGVECARRILERPIP